MNKTIICKCGCEITYDGKKLSEKNIDGEPCLPVLCPNCNEVVLYALFPFWNLKLTSKQTGETLLSISAEVQNE